MRISPVGLDDHPLAAPEDVGHDHLGADDDPDVLLPGRVAARSQEGVETGLQRRADLTALGIERGKQPPEGPRALAAAVAVPHEVELVERDHLFHEGLVGGLNVADRAQHGPEVEEGLGGTGDREAVEPTDLERVDGSAVMPDPGTGAQASRAGDVDDERRGKPESMRCGRREMTQERARTSVEQGRGPAFAIAPGPEADRVDARPLDDEPTAAQPVPDRVGRDPGCEQLRSAHAPDLWCGEGGDDPVVAENVRLLAWSAIVRTFSGHRPILAGPAIPIKTRSSLLRANRVPEASRPAGARGPGPRSYRP